MPSPPASDRTIRNPKSKTTLGTACFRRLAALAAEAWSTARVDCAEYERFKLANRRWPELDVSIFIAPRDKRLRRESYRLSSRSPCHYRAAAAAPSRDPPALLAGAHLSHARRTFQSP